MKKIVDCESVNVKCCDRDGECLLPGISYNSKRNFVRYGDNIIKLNTSISEILVSIFLENRNKKINAEKLIKLLLEKGISVKEKLKVSKRDSPVDIIKDYMNNLKNSPLYFIHNNILIQHTPELSYTLKL